jgi:AraC-like DNA-binding protein
MVALQKEVYREGTNLLPEVPALGWVATQQARPIIRPHTHRAAYEVTYVIRGSLEWWVGNDFYHIPAGHAFLTRPGELHGAVDSMLHPNENCYVHVAFPERGPLPGLSRDVSRQLADDFAAMELRMFPADPAVERLIREMLAEHRRPSPYAVAGARAALHLLLVRLVRDYQTHVGRPGVRIPRRAARVDRLLRWIDEHLGDIESMDDLAAEAGLSPTHFRRIFQREVGLPPTEYVARRRIHRAKQLLSRPRPPSVLDVAMTVGFGSSQYFATVFKRYTGVTPSDYQEHVARRQTSG